MALIRRILVLCGVILLASGCATIRKLNPIESHTLEARQLTQQAETAIHQSEWDVAETKLVEAIERCPEDNRAREVLADVLWRRGEHRAAAEQMSRSIELSGRRDPLALAELGQMELSIGKLDQSLLHADEAINQDNSLADAWTLRGFVLRAQNKHQDALSSFLRSLSIRNEDPRTRLEIAKIYRETGQPQRALAILGAAPKETIVGCPHFPNVCYLRGLLMRDLQRPADAVVALMSARQSGCEDPGLLFHLADAQLAAGEILQARATLADARTSAAPEFQVALQELHQRIDSEQPIVESVWR